YESAGARVPAFAGNAIFLAGRRLSGVAFAGAGEQRVKRLGLIGAAQLLADRRIAQETRHARQRAQVEGAALRRQQDKDKIDRLVVDRIKRDRPFEPGEEPVGARQLGEFAVRDGDAAPDPGAAEALALGEGVVDA